MVPNFDTKPFSHILHSLEKNSITVTDLLTQDPSAIAARCTVDIDVHKLSKAIAQALQQDVAAGTRKRKTIDTTSASTSGVSPQAKKTKQVQPQKPIVRTLDKKIDEALHGGLQVGHVTEIVGEARTGKTCFTQRLLLSVQLPPSKGGLGKAAIYISTEAPLNTKRLAQIHHFQHDWDDLEPHERPSLDHVHAITVSNLEEQEHVLRFQLPVAIQRYNVGLVVLDSVAANFRAEHGTRTPAQLADRAIELTNVGNVLRRLAIDHQIALVVTNQVSDRFDDSRSLFKSSSVATSSSAMSGPILPPAVAKRRQETQSLDHQQRFFTGWGDESKTNHEQLKTPALGLAWANQISARIVLKMESGGQEYAGGNIWKDKKTVRTFAVVFAPWAPPSDVPIRYEIAMQGVVSLREPEKLSEAQKAIMEEHADLLDEALWATDEDEEFP